MKRLPTPYRKWYTRWKKAGAPVFPAATLVHLIYWLDAAGDTDDETIQPAKTLAVGFLIDASPESVKIAMEVFQDGSAREFLVIPAKMVHRIVDVAKVPR